MQHHRQFRFPHINFNQINCTFCRPHTSQTLKSAAKYNTKKKKSKICSFLSQLHRRDLKEPHSCFYWGQQTTVSLCYISGVGYAGRDASVPSQQFWLSSK